MCFFYQKYGFYALKVQKIPLKSNKKRRMGTIPCILFCVLIWQRKRDLQGAKRRNSATKWSVTGCCQSLLRHKRSTHKKEKKKKQFTLRELLSFATKKRARPCERTTKSTPIVMLVKLEFVNYIGVPTSIKLPSKS